MSLNQPLAVSNSYSYQSYQRQRQLTLGDLLLENRIEYFTLIWGSQRAGTMLVPISSRLTAPPPGAR